MNNWDTFSEKQKWIVCSYITLWYIIVTNAYTFKLTNMIFTPLGKMANVDAATCDVFAKPTMFGVIVHVIVFFLGVRAIMKIPVPDPTTSDM